MKDIVVVDDTTENDDPKQEMKQVEEEEVQVGGGFGPENGLAHTVDPGGANQNGTYARPGVQLVGNENVCASRQPKKRLNERNERESDGAPERDCAVCGHVVWDGFTGIQGLCLAESEELVQWQGGYSDKPSRDGREWDGNGEETKGGNEDSGGKGSPGCTDARVRQVEGTRPPAELKTVHAVDD